MITEEPITDGPFEPDKSGLKADKENEENMVSCCLTLANSCILCLECISLCISCPD